VVGNWAGDARGTGFEDLGNDAWLERGEDGALVEVVRVRAPRETWREDMPMPVTSGRASRVRVIYMDPDVPTAEEAEATQKRGRGINFLAGGLVVAMVSGYAGWEMNNWLGYDMLRDWMPLLRRLTTAEGAHRWAVRAAKWGYLPVDRTPDPAVLHTEVWPGMPLTNPVGLAAGFDKDAEGVPALLLSGFGFVEVGSVTPRPQPGNPQPRVFRLEEDRAVINRYGFNSKGMEAARVNLLRHAQKWWDRKEVQPGFRGGKERRYTGAVGVNLGKNKDTPAEKAGDDYKELALQLSGLADYVVVNVSSPNTPGLRALQGRKELRTLLKEVQGVMRDNLETCRNPKTGRPPPLLVKIAPDLTRQDLKDVAAVVLELGIDGVIVGNTTLSRPSSLLSRPELVAEAGGLSGEPLFVLSTRVLADMYRFTKGRVPLIGAGGVSDGPSAYAKIRAGASLVQLYSALSYEGPGLPIRVKRELATLLEGDGFRSVEDAVGADVPEVRRKPKSKEFLRLASQAVDPRGPKPSVVR